MVQFRTMQKRGWTVFIVGLICILTGILAKRVFNAAEYLVVFHIVGGICLIVGGMMALSERGAGQ